jgi:putative N6-adenine-specific DNA methylase
MNFDKIVIKTYAGLEEDLAQELQNKLGLKAQIGRRIVTVKGDLHDVYLINLHIGNALRVLVPIVEFQAFNDKQLYKKAMDFPWEDWIDANDTFVIDPVIHSTIFTHSQFAALKVKDAIVDRFKEKYDERPSVDKRKPTLRINLHIDEKKVSLMADSSGTSLHQRGYKKFFHPAPISEVLAYGILSKIGWKNHPVVVDPMCGSGTFISEAGMIEGGLPPNFYRNWFGFMNWKTYDEFEWNNILNQAKMAKKPIEKSYFCHDISSEFVDKTKQNIESAGLAQYVNISELDFLNSSPPAKNGILIFNPPYDERLGLADTKEFYKGIGDTLKTNWKGWEAWMITSNLEALKFVGLKPSRRIILFNGPLECRLVKYELYDGSKKGKYINKEEN